MAQEPQISPRKPVVVRRLSSYLTPPVSPSAVKSGASTPTPECEEGEDTQYYMDGSLIDDVHHPDIVAMLDHMRSL